jgi:alpha-tubulin suppressor-like RCC1 family protein
MLNARSFLTAAVVAFAAACGSDSTTTDPGTKPPPVVNVASVDVTPQTGEVIVGQTTKFTCGVAQLNGATYCWGANSIGQTGDGQKINYGNVFVSTPQQVVGGLAFKSVSLGNQYACGVTTAGLGYCWGSNSTKLGAGPISDSSSPVAVLGGYTFKSISAGALHACGVTTANAVYCWGRNGNGGLGVAPPNGSSASDTPVRAGGNFTASEVSAAGTGTGSSGHTCAIAVDRLTAYCFGRNDVGQLGNGATTSASVANATPAIILGQKPL